MPRISLFGLALGAALSIAGPAAAHGALALEGTISAIKSQAIDVRTKEGAVIAVTIDSDTRAKGESKPMEVSDLKIGQKVYIEGYGDTVTDMLALNILVTNMRTPAGKR